MKGILPIALLWQSQCFPAIMQLSLLCPHDNDCGARDLQVF
jgi:hypothetical protein